MGFPLPEFYYSGETQSREGFTDFRAWVDGSSIELKTDIHAFVAGTWEITNELVADSLSTDTFAGYDHTDETGDGHGYGRRVNQLKSLFREQLTILRRLGAIDENNVPMWTVRRLYYWTQRFPAGKVVRIAHTYRPHSGWQRSFTPTLPLDGCASDSILNDFSAIPNRDGFIYTGYRTFS